MAAGTAQRCRQDLADEQRELKWWKEYAEKHISGIHPIASTKIERSPYFKHRASVIRRQTVHADCRRGFRRVAMALGRARKEVEGVMTRGGVDG